MHHWFCQIEPIWQQQAELTENFARLMCRNNQQLPQYSYVFILKYIYLQIIIVKKTFTNVWVYTVYYVAQKGKGPMIWQDD